MYTVYAYASTPVICYGLDTDIRGLGINCIKNLLTDYTTLQNVQMVYSNIWYFARSCPLRNNEVPVYTGVVDESH